MPGFAQKAKLPAAAVDPRVVRGSSRRPYTSAARRRPLFVLESSAAGAVKGTAFGDLQLEHSRRQREMAAARADMSAMLSYYPSFRRLDVPNRRPPAPPQHRPPPPPKQPNTSTTATASATPPTRKPPSQLLAPGHRAAPQCPPAAHVPAEHELPRPSSVPGGGEVRSTRLRPSLSRLHTAHTAATGGSTSSRLVESDASGVGGAGGDLSRYDALAFVRSRALIGRSIATSASASALLEHTSRPSERPYEMTPLADAKIFSGPADGVLARGVDPESASTIDEPHAVAMVDRAMEALERERRRSTAALRRLQSNRPPPSRTSPASSPTNNPRATGPSSSSKPSTDATGGAAQASKGWGAQEPARAAATREAVEASVPDAVPQGSLPVWRPPPTRTTASKPPPPPPRASAFVVSIPQPRRVWISPTWPPREQKEGSSWKFEAEQQ